MSSDHAEMTVRSGFDASTAQFQAAQKARQKLAPVEGIG